MLSGGAVRGQSPPVGGMRPHLFAARIARRRDARLGKAGFSHRALGYAATLEGPDVQVADCIMSVAESTSLRAFGGACQLAIHALTGSSTIGVYMLKSYEPQLLHSRNVPDGFLADYRNGMAKCDPLIERALEDGQVVDGASLYGPHGWPRSIALTSV